MTRAPVLAALLLAASVSADISENDPDELCGLLDEFGVETTPFEVVSGGRPLCYTIAHPGSTEIGSEFSFRVLGDDGLNHTGLFVQAQGRVEDFVRGPQYELYLSMVERLLARFFDPVEVVEVLGLIRQMNWNERSGATGRGIDLQFYRIRREFAGLSQYAELRLTLTDICPAVADDTVRLECLSDSMDFGWRYRRELMQ